MNTRILCGIAAGSIAGGALAATAYTRDMERAYGRIRRGSTVIPSPHGDVEYSEGGSGPAVLMIHGSGGGYDQGELLVQAMLGDRFRWITPSRFGYLRSTCREGATFDDQAHAYARLLDHLGVKTVAVAALSHGGPSALLFAALYPERVSSLTLLSCGVASSGARGQAQASRQGDILTAIFKHDSLYWALSKLFRKRLLGLMGADEEVIAGLTREQRDLVDRIIEQMNPVSPRAAGAAFDNTAAMPNQRIAAIRAPTLIFHARDDTLQLHRHAEFAASTIPGARLISFPRGGHLLLSIEQATIRRALQKHILKHAGDLPEADSGLPRPVAPKPLDVGAEHGALPALEDLALGFVVQ